MAKLDLEFDCDDVFVKNSRIGVNVTMTGIFGVDFDKEEIAKCVSIRTMIEAHGIEDILDYLKDITAI